MPKDDRPHTLTRTNPILHTSSTYPCVHWYNSCAIAGTYKSTNTRTNNCTDTATSCLRPSSRIFDADVHATTNTFYHSSLRIGCEHTHNNVLETRRDNDDGDDTHELMIPLHALACAHVLFLLFLFMFTLA